MYGSRLLMTCMQSGSGMVIASWLTNQHMQDVSKKKSILRLVPLPPFWLAVFLSLMLWWESTPSWYVCKFLIFIKHCWFFHIVKGGDINSQFSIHFCSSHRLVFPNGRLRKLTRQVLIFLNTVSLGISTFYRTCHKNVLQILLVTNFIGLREVQAPAEVDKWSISFWTRNIYGFIEPW